MKRKSTSPKRLSYTAAFRAFDAIENAQTDLDGTFAVFSRLLDHTDAHADGFMFTMERHLKTDIVGLKTAIDRARDVILKPLQAADLPNADRMALGDRIAALEASEAADAAAADRPPGAGLALVVNNGAMMLRKCSRTTTHKAKSLPKRGLPEASLDLVHLKCQEANMPDGSTFDRQNTFAPLQQDVSTPEAVAAGVVTMEEWEALRRDARAKPHWFAHHGGDRSTASSPPQRPGSRRRSPARG